MLNNFPKFLIVFSIIRFVFTANLLGQQVYTPTYGDPFDEPWRWTDFDELIGKGVKCMSETGDGKIVFGLTKGLIIYDGVNWLEQNSSNGFTDAGVNHLVLSSDKRLYAGTTDGLYEFDGTNWSRIFPVNDQPNLGIGSVHSLAKQNGGGVVACFGDGNSQGLLFYERGSYGILASQKTINTLYVTRDAEYLIVPGNLCIKDIFRIQSIFQDSQDRYWVWERETDTTGYVFYFEKQGKQIAYSKLFTEEDGIIIGRETKFEEDGKGNIWTINSSFYKGLSIFDGKEWKQITLKGENSFLSVEYANHVMWIGGFGVLYAYKNNQWTIYKRPGTPIPISKIFVFLDSSGYLWVSGILGEVKRIDYSGTKWNSLQLLNYHCEDHQGNQWFIGVDNKVVVQKQNKWYAYAHSDGLPDAPVKIVCTKKGLICVAGSYKEQACLSFFDGIRWERQLFPNLSWGIDYRAVYEDCAGNLWVSGSVNNFLDKGQKGGLLKIKDPGLKTQENVHYLPPGETSLATAYGFAQTKDNVIWACGKHLAKYSHDQWTRFSEIEPLNQYINSISNAPNGDLWIGTRRFGIYRLHNKKWVVYNADSSIKNNNITSILPLDKNDVWVATNGYISRFDGFCWANDLFDKSLAFSQEEGELQVQKDGTLWINRSSRNWKRRAIHNNLIEDEDKRYFSTIAYKGNTFAPETKITVYSQEVSAAGNTYVEWLGVDSWRETPASKLQYSYRLNNGKWSQFNSKTNQTFLNLKNGNYDFEVRARDVDFNIDPSPAKIHFTVLSPVWKQVWFILLISAFLVVIIFYQFLAFRQKEHLKKLNTNLTQQREEISRKNIILQAQKEQILQQTINEKEQNRSKLRFFTNISHEFRTPLTVINGIIESLSEEDPKSCFANSSEQFAIIRRNSNRLLRLINQIMDFRKLDNNQVELRVSEIEVVGYIQKIYRSFKSFARKYGISLHITCPFDELVCWLDIDKLDKIVLNLLSNAIKATPENGIISLFMNKNKLNGNNFLELSIDDSGIGIPENQLDEIFERFYQIGSKSIAGNIGSGIGLSLVHRYVNLHHGTVKVVSSQDPKIQGERGFSTRFTIKLPMDKSYYGSNEILERHIEVNNVAGMPYFNKDMIGEDAGNDNWSVNPEERKEPHILIVEDHVDLRHFMKNALGREYSVLEARNGKEGYDLSLSYLPDLIVSDIMMPEMSGSELCHKIKSDFRTSHIPVILLTALTTNKDKIEGYQKGADDYITKPFNLELLSVRINNILSIRERLRQKFKNEEVIRPDEEKVLSMDTVFLQKIKSILEKSYSNPQFNVEELSLQFGISSRHLLHKLKSLVGITPVEYIKIFRLEKAASMLSGRKGNISEIAYQTGFSDSSYFGKCFSKHYGISPSEYQKRR